MKAEELMTKYAMAAHVENGAFVEKHYEDNSGNRAASGSIYYYVAPGEYTEFHRIDCDEYWSFVQGSPLEICIVNEDGLIEIKKLGVDADSDPLVYLRKGVIFASRSLSENDEGSFLICITVPRFQYEGFELFTKEHMIKEYPGIKDIWYQ